MPYHGSDLEAKEMLKILRELGGSATTKQIRDRLYERLGTVHVNNAASSLRKWAREEHGIEDAVDCEFEGTYKGKRGQTKKIYRYTLCEDLGGPVAQQEEQRSPKPRAEGSSPSRPASENGLFKTENERSRRVKADRERSGT